DVAVGLAAQPHPYDLGHGDIEVRVPAEVFSDVAGRDAESLEPLPEDAVREVPAPDHVARVGASSRDERLLDRNARGAVLDAGLVDCVYEPLLERRQGDTAPDRRRRLRAHSRLKSRTLLLTRCRSPPKVGLAIEPHRAANRKPATKVASRFQQK